MKVQNQKILQTICSKIFLFSWTLKTVPEGFFHHLDWEFESFHLFLRFSFLNKNQTWRRLSIVLKTYVQINILRPDEGKVASYKLLYFSFCHNLLSLFYQYKMKHANWNFHIFKKYFLLIKFFACFVTYTKLFTFNQLTKQTNIV